MKNAVTSLSCFEKYFIFKGKKTTWTLQFLCTCCSLQTLCWMRSFLDVNTSWQCCKENLQVLHCGQKEKKNCLSQHCPLAVWQSIFTDISTASKFPGQRELCWWKLHVQKACSLHSRCATLHDSVKFKCCCFYHLLQLILNPGAFKLPSTSMLQLINVFFSCLLSVKSSF